MWRDTCLEWAKRDRRWADCPCIRGISRGSPRESCAYTRSIWDRAAKWARCEDSTRVRGSARLALVRGSNPTKMMCCGALDVRGRSMLLWDHSLSWNTFNIGKFNIKIKIFLHIILLFMKSFYLISMSGIKYQFKIFLQTRLLFRIRCTQSAVDNRKILSAIFLISQVDFFLLCWWI